MCLMGRILKTSSMRQIIYVGTYFGSRREGHRQAQNLRLMMMTVTDPNQRLPPMSPSLIKKSAIIGKGAKVQPIKDWEMMLLVGLCTKSQSLCLLEGLIGQTFLSGSHSPCLPCIMVEQTQWSMLVILIKEWMYTQGMRPCYARCSLLTWDRQQ